MGCGRALYSRGASDMARRYLGGRYVFVIFVGLLNLSLLEIGRQHCQPQDPNLGHCKLNIDVHVPAMF